jgi:hypothetical protein
VPGHQPFIEDEVGMRKSLRHLLVLVQGMLILVLMSGRLRADSGMCGGAMVILPFTDVVEFYLLLPNRRGVFLRSY